MTKAQLIAKTAERCGISQKDAALVCNALFDTAIDTLKSGEPLHLSGFGVFSVKEKEAYTARNPKTNTPVEMPASRRITFTASKVLKEKINET